MINEGSSHVATDKAKENQDTTPNRRKKGFRKPFLRGRKVKELKDTAVAYEEDSFDRIPENVFINKNKSETSDEDWEKRKEETLGYLQEKNKKKEISDEERMQQEKDEAYAHWQECFQEERHKFSELKKFKNIKSRLGRAFKFVVEKVKNIAKNSAESQEDPKDNSQTFQTADQGSSQKSIAIEQEYAQAKQRLDQAEADFNQKFAAYCNHLSEQESRQPQYSQLEIFADEEKKRIILTQKIIPVEVEFQPEEILTLGTESSKKQEKKIQQMTILEAYNFYQGQLALKSIKENEVPDKKENYVLGKLKGLKEKYNSLSKGKKLAISILLASSTGAAMGAMAGGLGLAALGYGAIKGVKALRNFVFGSATGAIAQRVVQGFQEYKNEKTGMTQESVEEKFSKLISQGSGEALALLAKYDEHRRKQARNQILATAAASGVSSLAFSFWDLASLQTEIQSNTNGSIVSENAVYNSQQRITSNLSEGKLDPSEILVLQKDSSIWEELENHYGAEKQTLIANKLVDFKKEIVAQLTSGEQPMNAYQVEEYIKWKFKNMQSGQTIEIGDGGNLLIESFAKDKEHWLNNFQKRGIVAQALHEIRIAQRV